MERHPYVTRAIVDEFYYVYNKLGFGFLEQHYATFLEHRLRLAKLGVVREYAVQVTADGIELGFHKLDMVVQATVVVEIKATAVLVPHARHQLMNYLRATDLEVGLLLHFGAEPRWHKLYVPSRGRSRKRSSDCQPQQSVVSMELTRNNQKQPSTRSP